MSTMARLHDRKTKKYPTDTGKVQRPILNFAPRGKLHPWGRTMMLKTGLWTPISLPKSNQGNKKAKKNF
jgi:hypothetical protein